MRWKNIARGSRRIVKRFLVLVTELHETLDYTGEKEHRWLETAYIVQEYNGYNWYDWCWSTEEKYLQYQKEQET